MHELDVSRNRSEEQLQPTLVRMDLRLTNPLRNLR